MATCKKCNAAITDGKEYCEVCGNDKHEKVEESYLDGLLSQVMSEDDVRNTPDKRLSQQDQNAIEPLQENSNSDLDLDFSSADYEALFQDSEQATFDEIENTFSDLINDMEENTINNDNQKNNQVDDTKAVEEESEILDFLNSMDDNDDVLALNDYMESHFDEGLQDYSLQEDEDQNITDIADMQLEFTEMTDNDQLYMQQDGLQQEYDALDNSMVSAFDTLDNKTQNMSDVFSDALGGVTELEDNQIEEDLLRLIPEMEKTVTSDSLKDKNINKSQNTIAVEKKPAKGVIGTLFGNVREDLTEEEVERLKSEAIQSVEQKAQKKILAKEKKKKKALEKAALKNEKKAAAAKKKQEKLKAKKEAKTKKEIEIQNLMDEIDENNGRINRIGASIVFVLFAIIAVVVVIGTNIYTYSLNIENATYNFGLQRYNEAYNDVYGIDIKEEDIEIYDKIMTVMYVNKQLNSYNTYSAIDKYPEALDSLLKGLERYDKYIKLATILGIKTDLDYVRSLIISELNNVFKLTEEDALNLINIEDQAEYSIEVYDVVLEQMNTQLTKE